MRPTFASRSARLPAAPVRLRRETVGVHACSTLHARASAASVSMGRMLCNKALQMDRDRTAALRRKVLARKYPREQLERGGSFACRCSRRSAPLASSSTDGSKRSLQVSNAPSPHETAGRRIFR